ncbi:HNH endonuclease [Staphylococcus phage PG-2021_67]
MENEIWKDIPGYEGLYQVSNLGRVKSLPKKLWNGRGYFYSKEKILKQALTGNKKDNKRRLMVVLCKEGKRTYNVHKLVAMTFLGEKPKGFIVCHNDGNHLNNNIENLRYDTYKENTKDSYRHNGRFGRGKLKIEDVISIREEYKNKSMKEICDKYDIGRESVYNIINNKTYSWINKQGKII